MSGDDLTCDLARIEAELRSRVPRTQQVHWAGGREKACQKDLEECSYHIPALSSGSGKETEQIGRPHPRRGLLSCTSHCFRRAPPSAQGPLSLDVCPAPPSPVGIYTHAQADLRVQPFPSCPRPLAIHPYSIPSCLQDPWLKFSST